MLKYFWVHYLQNNFAGAGKYGSAAYDAKIARDCETNGHSFMGISKSYAGEIL
jgi:hypothetical protein